MLPQDADRGEAGPSLAGTRIDKYEILRLVGRGGMGAVYEALNTTIDKRVAMKCIDASLARNEEANARFQREALAASAVESPHIVQIFDAGMTSEGMPYIVMELLRGQDLGRCLVEVGRLELADALHVAVQVLRGLRQAHAAGIIHRDLKPDNVYLVEREDEPYAVKILDFGVSKINRPMNVPLETLTQQGSVVGTPYYMSPEQAQAFPDVDARTDLYSVGAILYECLAGRPPHVGQAYEQVIVNICMKDAEDVRTYNEAVPDPVAQVIAKALQREREQRFSSAREMLDALMACAPAELRSAFRSVPSGMRRIGAGLVGHAGAGEGSAGGRGAERGEGGEPPSGVAEGVAARGRPAESGMMSVATTPSDPPELPMGSPGRPWALAAVVVAGLVVGAGALVLSAFGDADRATSGRQSVGEAEASSSALASAALPTVAAPTSVVDAAPKRRAAGDEDAGGPPVPPARPTATPARRPVASAPRPRAPASRPPPPALPTVTGQTHEPAGLPLLED